MLHLATHGFFYADPIRVPATTHFDAIHLVDIPGHGTAVVGLVPAYEDDDPEVPEPLRRLGAGLDNPLLRSGLALAGANTWLSGGALPPDAGKGLLAADDVAALDLFGTDLVVLSACDTGLGEIVRGEGVFGLRRAFVVGGAATLVMSLWKVPDEETADLMVDFYRRLLDGEGRAAALRHAQLAMPGCEHPFFWGAFICQGVADPMPTGSLWVA